MKISNFYITYKRFLYTINCIKILVSPFVEKEVSRLHYLLI
ncbi:hypothetical protein SAMN04487988_101235 [Algoriphagus hitonicola]|uniref:Uncharacterized protein n=1 Tax=Algoriphagus hitonicola TaxID=435880 RepID=A0A1I2NS19_9BACT|nr:hypothetical protein SAMN04487988_101235 [Algoriphagus hitonicola]